jgi:hypothetical protein
MLEVGLVQGVGQVFGIVDHEDTARCNQLPERDARGATPRAVAGIGGRVVPQQHDVEFSDTQLLFRIGLLDRGE